jgi:chaperonin GroEL (HSP60 family)
LENQDQNLGVKIMQNAMKTPFKVLCQNADLNHAPIMEKIIND